VAAEEQLSVLHISGAQINAEQGSQPQLPWAGRGLPPWHRCLLQVLHTCILAARSVHASVESSGSGTGGDGGVEASRHGAAVLEASLEVGLCIMTSILPSCYATCKLVIVCRVAVTNTWLLTAYACNRLKCCCLHTT
jgi:hypothetical protein